jgi:hypothetical protein
LTAEDLRFATPEDVSKLEDAMQFLRVKLAGGCRLVSEIEEEATDQRISLRTLGKARTALKLRSARQPGANRSKFVISLPPTEDKTVEAA